MNPLDIITTSLRSLGSSKLRSGLTLLGIIIGITAVSVLMSVGRGVQQNIVSSIQSQGTNLLFVESYGESTLTLQDAEALMDPLFAPSIKAVSPQIISSGEIVAGRENTNAQVIGVTPDYALVRNVDVASGQFINPAHVQNISEMAVISASVAETLFDTADPLGQRIRISGRQFVVTGVLEESRTAFGAFSREQVFIPITTSYYRMSRERTTQGDIVVSSIDAEAVSQDAVEDAELEIASILQLRHRITDENDFEINTLQDLIETVNQITAVLVLFLGAVSGISLLVGGIGVMNIMLVSVTERTREIGVRKAMGAKRRDILLQFITEAIFLTTSGGIIGLAISVILSPLTNLMVNLLGRGGGDSGIRVVFHPDVAILAISVSAIVGLLSGIYPATRAARMHPIDALRHE